MISPLLNQAQLAKILGVTEWSVWSMRKKGILPPAVKVGRNLRWQESTIEKWIQENETPSHEIDPVLSNRGEKAAAARGHWAKKPKSQTAKKMGRPTKKSKIEGV